jgi:hypothetical protein
MAAVIASLIASVIASVMASVIASPDEIVTEMLVVSAASVFVPLAQAASGTAISASRASERRIHRP